MVHHRLDGRRVFIHLSSDFTNAVSSPPQGPCPNGGVVPCDANGVGVGNQHTSVNVDGDSIPSCIDSILYCSTPAPTPSYFAYAFCWVSEMLPIPGVNDTAVFGEGIFTISAFGGNSTYGSGWNPYAVAAAAIRYVRCNTTYRRLTGGAVLLHADRICPLGSPIKDAVFWSASSSTHLATKWEFC